MAHKKFRLPVSRKFVGALELGRTVAASWLRKFDAIFQSLSHSDSIHKPRLIASRISLHCRTTYPIAVANRCLGPRLIAAARAEASKSDSRLLTDYLPFCTRQFRTIESMIDQSLFDASGAPLQVATDWVSILMLGPMAISLCVIGVAFVGYIMLTGRLSLQLAGKAVLGVVLVISAPSLASVFISQSHTNTAVTVASIEPATQVGRSLTPASEDPYAGASLRRD